MAGPWQKLSLLKELFSSTRLIAKVKPEYQASFSEAVGRDVAPLGIQGATVEAQSSAMGIEVLKIKDGFDILNLVFELQTLKLFEFVELDFQQSLAQSSGLGMENVDEETMNEARKAWQQINMQYSTIKEVKVLLGPFGASQVSERGLQAIGADTFVWLCVMTPGAGGPAD